MTAVPENSHRTLIHVCAAGALLWSRLALQFVFLYFINYLQMLIEDIIMVQERISGSVNAADLNVAIVH